MEKIYGKEKFPPYPYKRRKNAKAIFAENIAKQGVNGYCECYDNPEESYKISVG